GLDRGDRARAARRERDDRSGKERRLLQRQHGDLEDLAALAHGFRLCERRLNLARLDGLRRVERVLRRGRRLLVRILRRPLRRVLRRLSARAPLLIFFLSLFGHTEMIASSNLKGALATAPASRRTLHTVVSRTPPGSEGRG